MTTHLSPHPSSSPSPPRRRRCRVALLGFRCGSPRSWGTASPGGTLAVNLIGSFVLGLLAEFLARTWNPPPELRDAIRVGFLGAFTTFSTFSLDAYTLLIEHRNAVAGLGYILGSVVLGLLALVGGLMAARAVLP